MMFEQEPFEIEFEGKRVMVKAHDISGQEVYRIQFLDDTSPLTITRSSTANGMMWMSLPQGRQKEAVKIGAKIMDYLKNK